MDRLTEHDLVGQNNAEPIVTACNNCDIWKQLCEYKDLEEQGRLIELPCAVGDTVWQITRNFISEFKIKSFICDNEGIFFYWECINGIYINILGFSDNRIGKDVFLTKEEAEAKLKELEGEKE